MKQLLCFFAVLTFAVASSPAQTDLIAQIHFLGGDKISADTNCPGFTNEFCSTEARALESQTLDKLSAVPATWFKSKLPAHAIDCSKQLRPLFDDFLKSEWVFEIRDTTNGSPEYALAIRLDNQRAQLWSTNLRALIESWTTMRAQDTSDGWRLKKDLPPNLFQFSRQGDWVVLDCGQNELPLANEIVASAAKTADTNWLTANLDWPRLARLYPELGKLDFPKFAFQAVGNAGYFYITGLLDLSQPLPSLKKWQIPTNVIPQLFDSFTAARGIGPWLERQNWFQPFKLQPQPDQFYVWALPRLPFMTYAAEPMPDANAALTQFDHHLATDMEWQSQFIMPLHESTTGGKTLFTGVPFISPYVQADRESSGNFLSGGFFPNLPGARSLPPLLLAQLDAPGLVYYHWEDTADRLNALPELAQLLCILTKHQQLQGDSVAQKWVNKIQPTPGATITVATESAPDEVTFIRTGPNGFTALEVVALANWLGSPNFPSLVIPRAQDL
jgi:hypothetical protein